MAGDGGRKVGIAPGGEHGEAVPREPEEQPGDPLLEAKPHRRGERAVEDRDPTRRAADSGGAAAPSSRPARRMRAVAAPA